jgi:hypothetical protein
MKPEGAIKEERHLIGQNKNLRIWKSGTALIDKTFEKCTIGKAVKIKMGTNFKL